MGEFNSDDHYIYYCGQVSLRRNGVALIVNSSVQFSRSVMSDSLWPHELQHTRLPCPSPSAWVCSNSCPLSQWCIQPSHSLLPNFSFWPQSFPASESFPMSQFFASGGQSIRASALASVLPRNIQGWFPLGLSCNSLICLLSKGLSKVFSNTAVKSISSLALSLLYGPALTSIHDYMGVSC